MKPSKELDVLFRGSAVLKKWDGQGTRFEGLLDFSKAKLNDFVYLENIEQGERQRDGARRQAG